jgi:hypothetical protein
LPDTVDDALEVVDIGDPESGKCVWVAGDGEGLDELGEVVDGMVDVADLCSGREAELDERLEVASAFGVIEDGRVAADVARLLEAVDPALGRGRRAVDQAADLAGRPPPIRDEQVEDPVVELVECVCRHAKIVRQSGSNTQILIVMVARAAACVDNGRPRAGESA